MSCVTATSCTAVGCGHNGDSCAATVCMAVGDGSRGTLAERWNGCAWSRGGQRKQCVTSGAPAASGPFQLMPGVR